MLWLSQGPKDEGVVIHTPAGLIHVKVGRVRGNHVQLGFQAPREFEIRRSELDDGRPLAAGPAAGPKDGGR